MTILQQWQIQPESDTPGLFIACVSVEQRDAILRLLAIEQDGVCALTLDDPPVRCARCGATEEDGECPLP